VKAILRLPRRATYADYLATERGSDRRHEFLDGVIVAMAGGSDEHNAIAFRFAVVFGGRLAAGGHGYTPDQRFWIAAAARSRYSDGSIICGKPAHPAHDAQATTNPLIVLEVLSPSSEGDDQGDKRCDFQSLASLQAYVLAAQDARCIQVYRRDERGDWRDAPDVYRSGDSFELPRLTHPIEVDEIYTGILDVTGNHSWAEVALAKFSRAAAVPRWLLEVVRLDRNGLRISRSLHHEIRDAAEVSSVQADQRRPENDGGDADGDVGGALAR
jgi:Uma2 family endonuclease